MDEIQNTEKEQYTEIIYFIYLHRFFHDSIHVYSPRTRADNLGCQNFSANIELLLLRSFLRSFIMILLIVKEREANNHVFVH